MIEQSKVKATDTEKMHQRVVEAGRDRLRKGLQVSTNKLDTLPTVLPNLVDRFTRMLADLGRGRLAMKSVRREALFTGWFGRRRLHCAPPPTELVAT